MEKKNIMRAIYLAEEHEEKLKTTATDIAGLDTRLDTVESAISGGVGELNNVFIAEGTATVGDTISSIAVTTTVANLLAKVTTKNHIMLRLVDTDKVYMFNLVSKTVVSDKDTLTFACVSSASKTYVVTAHNDGTNDVWA